MPTCDVPITHGPHVRDGVPCEGRAPRSSNPVARTCADAEDRGAHPHHLWGNAVGWGWWCPGAPAVTVPTWSIEDADAVPPINHPRHYTRNGGIECIQVVEHMSFLRGNAIKYLWRAGLKGDTTDDTVSDLRKAIWYIEREIAQIKARQES